MKVEIPKKVDVEREGGGNTEFSAYLMSDPASIIP
jgi:hypothetical protein